MNEIIDYLKDEEILAALAEEAAELSQAALKLRRAITGINPTPKSREECFDDLQEEFADVVNCIKAYLCTKENCKTFKESSKFIAESKKSRWLERLEKRGAVENKETRPTAHWDGESDGYADGNPVYDVWNCSACGHCIDDGTDDPELLPKFCPNCGARMVNDCADK